MKDYLLKDAASTLGINYSTAKTILRIFRIEKRIEKKNSDEDREARMLMTNIQPNQPKFVSNQNETPDNSTKQLTSTLCAAENITHPSQSKSLNFYSF